MFNDDEVRSALTKMYEFSPVDGFVEISEGLGDMIKSLANEPSLGLFYVQQHACNAVPNVVNLRNNIVAKTREISLHTDDSEDSITMVRSMMDCGVPIVDDMIKDIRRSLDIMSLKERRKGLISSRSGSGFGTWRTGSWVQTTSRGDVSDVEKAPAYYLSSVFKSGKQKATKGTLQDSSECKEDSANGSANAVANVGEELPVSGLISVGNEEDEVLVDNVVSDLSVSRDFDEFNAEKEARFEEWLEGDDDTQHKRVQ